MTRREAAEREPVNAEQSSAGAKTPYEPPEATDLGPLVGLTLGGIATGAG